ncbi:hypothetical protein NBRGN_045_01220 [Nocardia brasiliensis NBRC 14402]|uniref:hypothetical protein n=1 Tax=Nocardia brasiliensis TaxID=37326 RepID=UPI0002D2C0B3|nr:hypothetical protein [Nocardia brasiliensis]ASF09906.1 hypothetical protein CEQ30_23950 [Nocardia brasiliensis]GAJ82019.1 hypothetical protein NBRGN_045_01220 [Nocardia brasiliensis NBRC 14402]SUB55006.1 Uncharacterised protein [Nocardia brasiliensis]
MSISPTLGVPTADNARENATASGDHETAALAGPALILGVILLIAAFTTLDRIPGWADDYGAVLVYLAFFLYMSTAGRLTWWGVDTIYAQLKDRRSGR